MEIGERIRQLRTEHKLSQGDVEAKSGLLRCYISRVENGFTIPSVATLEKLSAAIGIPMYQLFYDGEPTEAAKQRAASYADRWQNGETKDTPEIKALRNCLAKMTPEHRTLLLYTAARMAKRTRRAA